MTLDSPINSHWEDTSLALSTDLTLTITNSVVEVVCTSSHDGKPEYDNAVYMRSFDMARGVVDSLGYAKGLGVAVIPESITKPDGITYEILVERPDLAELVTAFSSGSQKQSLIVGEMLSIVFSDLLIVMALNDLVASIALPHHAPVNCGRTVEAIRQMMQPRAGDRRDAWATMRENLNIDIAYLSFISDQSKGPRHGDRAGITPSAYEETIKRTWVVMNRFLEYKKRGSQALPRTEFPLLS